MVGKSITMNKTCKWTALFGIAWAVLGPLYWGYSDVRDEQYRKLRAVASGMLEASSSEDSPNNFIARWRNWAEQVSRLTDAEQTRSARCMMIVAISSGFILFLSLCVVGARQKNAERVAEPAAPNGGSAEAPPASVR